MGYAHIENLYKDQTILLFREAWALEKIHGTSSHISWNFNKQTQGRDLHFFAGGESHVLFVSLFNQDTLLKGFADLGLGPDQDITIYGEAYGGSQQKMSHTYGDKLMFIVFDVQIGETWLNVPNAEDVAKKLGLEFVHYIKVSLVKATTNDLGIMVVETSLDGVDAQRDALSVQAIRNGVSSIVGHNVLTENDGVVEVPNIGRVFNPKPREGIVIRPLVEMTDNRGNRVICKHKGDKFKETATPRPVVDPSKMKALSDANAVANEWVTATRLEHVLDKLPGHCMERMRDIIAAMQEDVLREGKGEIVESDAVKKAIGKKAAEMYKSFLKIQLEKS